MNDLERKNDIAKIAGSVLTGTLAICSFKLSAPLGIIVEETEEGEYTDEKHGTFARDSHTVVVNSRWFDNSEVSEIRYFLRYEARRLYQKSKMEELKKSKNRGEALSEADEDLLRRWENEQKRIIDALAFATAIDAIEKMDANGTVRDALNGIAFCKKAPPELTGTSSDIKGTIEDVAWEMIVEMSSEDNIQKFHDFFEAQHVRKSCKEN